MHKASPVFAFFFVKAVEDYIASTAVVGLLTSKHFDYERQLLFIQSRDPILVQKYTQNGSFANTRDVIGHQVTSKCDLTIYGLFSYFAKRMHIVCIQQLHSH